MAPERDVDDPSPLDSSESTPGDAFDVEELDRLLDLAGEVRDRINQSSRDVRLGLAWLFMTLALAAGSLGVSFALAGQTLGVILVLGKIIAGTLLLLAVLQLSSLRQASRSLIREECKLDEVLDVTREVEQAIRESHLVRPLAKARIRMRVSEFPLSVSKSTWPSIIRAFVRGGI